LVLSSGISAHVSRPYARLLATRGICNHFIGGNPGDRLRRAGYTNYDWAENLGCRSGNPFGAVLGSHRFFQNERPYSGGHYVNLMNAKSARPASASGCRRVGSASSSTSTTPRRDHRAPAPAL
jgi:hypothetical protein